MASMSAFLSLPTPKSRSFTSTPKPFKPIYLPPLARHTQFRCARTSLYVTRAGLDVPSIPVIRPGAAVESDKLPSEVRKRAMDAIDSSGRRVTVGDVSSKAGLKLDEAQRALQAVAADTDGFLEVSDEGDVLYGFPKDYRSKLAAKSLKIKLEPLIEKGKMTAEHVVRVSFGTALFVSIVYVYAAIIAIMLSNGGSGDRDKRGRSSGSGGGVNNFFCLTDLFLYWNRLYNRKQRASQSDGGMNFIDSVFSFVFGDGDPNQGIEEERWKLIGQYITSNGGVVTAEELAPYLDLETAEKTDDDSYILPVLLQFGGQPEVDEEGNILYQFPSLQRTAAPQRSRRKENVAKKWADRVGVDGKMFKERKWKFSKTSTLQRAMVIGLGGLNLYGVINLGTMLKNTSVNSSGFISFVSGTVILLQIYAGSFFGIPLIRWFLVQRENEKIEKRNRSRLQRALALESPAPSLRRKILSAREMAQRTFIGQDRIVYSTEKDLYEQDYDGPEFERKLQELKKFEQ